MSSFDNIKLKYKCPEEGCKASFTKAVHFEVHKRRHYGERPFACDVENCSKTYTNEAHLKRHKCFVHENQEKPITEVLCTVDGCRQAFSNKYSLKKHYNRKHNMEFNMLKCSHCLQEFKKKRQLKLHLYQHTSPEALTCSICNINFGSLYLYNKHKGNHKTYTCDCGLVFNRWTLFCAHRKKLCTVEKIDHKCVICNKVFTTKTNLKNHSLSHLEESQTDIYRCPYLGCKRSYKYKKNLNSHIMVYHEKRNEDIKINCTEEGCNAVLKSQKNLRQHIFNIHKVTDKKKKERAPRKDKGKRKKCMASIMSGIPLSVEENLTVIDASNNSKGYNDMPTKTPITEKLIESEPEKGVLNNKDAMFLVQLNVF